MIILTKVLAAGNSRLIGKLLKYHRGPLNIKLLDVDICTVANNINHAYICSNGFSRVCVVPFESELENWHV